MPGGAAQATTTYAIECQNTLTQHNNITARTVAEARQAMQSRHLDDEGKEIVNESIQGLEGEPARGDMQT